MTKKYEFTGEARLFNGFPVKRIRRLADGLVGGWIIDEAQLSHEGSCFVYDDAILFGNTKVDGDSQISGYTVIFDGEKIQMPGPWYGF